MVKKSGLQVRARRPSCSLCHVKHIRNHSVLMATDGTGGLVANPDRLILSIHIRFTGHRDERIQRWEPCDLWRSMVEIVDIGCCYTLEQFMKVYLRRSYHSNTLQQLMKVSMRRVSIAIAYITVLFNYSLRLSLQLLRLDRIFHRPPCLNPICFGCNLTVTKTIGDALLLYQTWDWLCQSANSGGFYLTCVSMSRYLRDLNPDFHGPCMDSHGTLYGTEIIQSVVMRMSLRLLSQN